MRYAEYIRSPAWAEMREARLKFDGRRCVDCREDGTASRLEVHHLTYDRLGHERIEDLVTLCNCCHSREHDHPPMVGPVAGPKVAELTRRARERERDRDLEDWMPLLAAFARAVDDFEATMMSERVYNADVLKTVRRLRREHQVLIRKVFGDSVREAA